MIHDSEKTGRLNWLTIRKQQQESTLKKIQEELEILHPNASTIIDLERWRELHKNDKLHKSLLLEINNEIEAYSKLQDISELDIVNELIAIQELQIIDDWDDDGNVIYEEPETELERAKLIREIPGLDICVIEEPLTCCDELPVIDHTEKYNKFNGKLLSEHDMPPEETTDEDPLEMPRFEIWADKGTGYNLDTNTYIE